MIKPKNQTLVWVSKQTKNLIKRYAKDHKMYMHKVVSKLIRDAIKQENNSGLPNTGTL